MASGSDGVPASQCGSILHSADACNQPDAPSSTAMDHKAAAVSAPVMSVAYWAQPREGKVKAADQSK